MIINFIFYNILQILALVPLPLYFLYRKLKGKIVVGNLLHRVGFVPKNETDLPAIWFHACSVGETMAISEIVNELKLSTKNPIYFTTSTLSGYNIAKKNINADYFALLPFDFLIPVLVALYRIKSKTLILLEAEFWPNLIYCSYLNDIKIMSLNSRIPEKSASRYLKFKWFLSPLLNLFAHFYTQSNKDTTLFAQLGVENNKLETIGDIKIYSAFKKKNKTAKIKKTKHKIILAGSIHEGELDFYLESFAKLKNSHDLKLILAPRHFAWKDKLIDKIKTLNTNYFVWDENNATPDLSTIFENNDILLVCKLGELFNLYQIANIYCLGGTFVPVGGHNLLEPAMWGVSSIVGPYNDKCLTTLDPLAKHGGAIVVKNKTELQTKLDELLTHNEFAHKMGAKALEWAEREEIFVAIGVEKLRISLCP